MFLFEKLIIVKHYNFNRDKQRYFWILHYAKARMSFISVNLSSQFLVMETQVVCHFIVGED